MRGSRARSARTLVSMAVRSRMAGYCRLGATRGGAMGFDYGKYFGEIKLTHDLTTRAAERTWRLAAPEATPARKPIVLYLGCNVLRTSHMIRTVTAVFDRLGLDYLAVGGPTYCCATVHHPPAHAPAGHVQ